jgi:hypothetical protein
MLLTKADQIQISETTDMKNAATDATAEFYMDNPVMLYDDKIIIAKTTYHTTMADVDEYIEGNSLAVYQVWECLSDGNYTLRAADLTHIEYSLSFNAFCDQFLPEPTTDNPSKAWTTREGFNAQIAKVEGPIGKVDYILRPTPTAMFLKTCYHYQGRIYGHKIC